MLATAARKHAAETLQIQGGYGYTTEFSVDRYYRATRITEICEGTSNIQQLIIAHSLLGRSASTAIASKVLRWVINARGRIVAAGP